MPIYAYRCESCGFEKDVLQKISDSPLTQCPECGKGTLRKQLTAAGFQLKGSGWYVTDFRGGNGGSAKGAKGNGSGEGGAAGEKAGSATSGSSTGSDGAGKTGGSSPAATPPSSSAAG